MKKEREKEKLFTRAKKDDHTEKQKYPSSENQSHKNWRYFLESFCVAEVHS